MTAVGFIEAVQRGNGFTGREAQYLTFTQGGAPAPTISFQ